MVSSIKKKSSYNSVGLLVWTMKVIDYNRFLLNILVSDIRAFSLVKQRTVLVAVDDRFSRVGKTLGASIATKVTYFLP